MKNIFYSLFSLIFLQGIAQNSTQQTGIFADKNYYLVDSLILEELSAPDRQLMDSCLKVFHQSKHDTDKVNALEGICENLSHNAWQKYQFFQYDIIKQNLKLKLPLAEKIKYLTYLTGALNNIANIYIDNGEFKKATHYHFKILKIRKWLGDKSGIAESLMGLGYLYMIQGETEKSLAIYKKCLFLQKELNDLFGLAKVMNNIGYIHQNNGNVEESIKYFHNSLKLYEKINNQKGLGEAYINIGTIYMKQNDIDKSLEYYTKAIPILEKIGAEQQGKRI